MAEDLSGREQTEPRVIGAINPVEHPAGGGFRFSHRYEADCPRGEATLWAMSDGTVRWRKPDDASEAKPYDWDPLERAWVCQMHGMPGCKQHPECIANRPSDDTPPGPHAPATDDASMGPARG